MSSYQTAHLHQARQEFEYCIWDFERLDWNIMPTHHGVMAEEEMITLEENPFNTGTSLKLESALASYEKGNISLGRAAEIADLSYGKMIEVLKERGIPLRFGAPVEVAEKRSKRLVATLKELRSSP